VQSARPLRKGGSLPKRTNLTLPDEPLPLSDGVLKSLREATRAMGKGSTARLVSDLLEKIANDSLYKAVLDEGLYDGPRLLASVPVISDQGQRQRQIIKHEQAMNDQQEHKAHILWVCRSGDRS
jgi:hypothetical protein